MRVLMLCLVMLLPDLLVAQTDQPNGPIPIENSAAQDAAIANRIRTIFAELDGFQDVTVTVASGIVTLRGNTLDSDAAQRLTTLVSRVDGVVAIENDITETTDVVERLNPALLRFRERLQQAIAFLPLLAIAIGVFALVFLVGILLARMRQPWDRLAPNAFIADIYRQIVRLVFAVAGLVIALDIMGAAALLSTILGAAGIVGLAIGFAVRDTVENFIASVLLSIRQPFRPNDTVEIEGDIGKVIRLTSRATILLSFDGNHIRIPNATVFKSRIVNYTRNDERRFLFELGVAPDTDLAQACQLALETVNSLPFVLKTPAASVWIETVGDSTITLQIAAWILQNDASFVLARGEAIRKTMLAFDAAGISMPEPGMRVLLPATDGDSQRDRPQKSVTPADAGTQDVATTADSDLDQIVAEERLSLQAADLLTTEAPEE